MWVIIFFFGFISHNLNAKIPVIRHVMSGSLVLTSVGRYYVQVLTSVGRYYVQVLTSVGMCYLQVLTSAGRYYVQVLTSVGRYNFRY